MLAGREDTLLAWIQGLGLNDEVARLGSSLPCREIGRRDMPPS